MKAILVEFFGTFFFLYVILATGNFIAIGAALALVVYLGGKISGGNFNPAVTIMMVLADKQKTSTLVPYILAQILGGICALQLYKTIM
jgi:aquaporin Z